MESSSSQPVNHSNQWANSGRSQTTAPADPLAFFDLIMSSAKAMSDKGNSNPLIRSSAPSSNDTPTPENRSETSGDDSWQDDSPRQASAYTASETPRSKQPSESSRDDAPEEDVAAMAELSGEASADKETTDQPDEAAQATAAAASTGEQLLAAPDTLDAEEEVAIEAPAEDVVAAEKKPVLNGDSEAGPPIETDAPLDTSAVTSDEKPEAEPDEPEVSAEVNEQEESDVQTQEVEQRDETDVPLEEADMEYTAEANEELSEQVEQNREKTTEEIELEAEAEVEATSEEVEPTPESKNDRDGSTRHRQESKVEAKSQGQSSAAPTSSAASPTVQATTAAAEAVAAASSTVSTQPSGTSGNATSGSNNVPGLNNLASLLQRGLQRGTLQKSTESKTTPQLDPKQQVRLINRVARAVESTPAGQSIKIRLNPSELGQLKVEITIEKGNMIAKIEAENPGTRQVLMQHLPQLRERLAENNINIQQFDVDLMGQESPQDGGTTDLADQQQQSGENLASRSPQLAGQKSVEEEGETPSEPKVNLEAERDSRNLNVTI